MISAWLQSESCEERGCIQRGEMLIAGAASPPLQLVGSEKAHVSVNARQAKAGLAMGGSHAQQQRA